MKKENILSGQMVHNLALVLGGGGAAGNAWQIGIIAGLAEAGLDMTEAADLVIAGINAGARPSKHCQGQKCGSGSSPALGRRRPARLNVPS